MTSGPSPSHQFQASYAKTSSSNGPTNTDPQQFGNVKSSSTTHCLISLLDFIHRNLDKRKTSVALTFIDFRKAFDLVHHNTVNNKGIKLLHANAVSWLADFLSDRRQVVRYRGEASTPQPLTCGVSQGTKMGLLCFLLLINDAMLDTPSRWKYVDDTTLGVTLNNNPDYTQLQTLLDTLHRWTTDNHVTINTTKSTIMHHSSSTHPSVHRQHLPPGDSVSQTARRDNRPPAQLEGTRRQLYQGGHLQAVPSPATQEPRDPRE